MSLASFPRVGPSFDANAPCEPLTASASFCGPPGAPLVHSIDCMYRSIPAAGQRPPAHRLIPKLPKSRENLDSNGSEELTAKEIAQLKKEKLKNFKEEFINRGELKSLCGIVEHRVKCAAMSTDHLLHEKRTRLRELLLSEEVAYATEYIAMCQKASASREEDLYKKAADLKAKVERERKQFVEEKLFEQKILSCDPVRSLITKKQLLEVKQDQLWQIKEKYAMQEAKREEEKMYYDLMMKNILSMKEDEEEIAKLEKMKQKETREMFREQMKWKEQKAEEERRLKEFERMQLEEEIRQLREEEARGKEEQLLKGNKRKEELKQLLEQERERKERRKREEEEIERTFNELLKLEAEKEKVKQTNMKEKLKREMDNYMQNIKELKRQREEEEKLYDRMLQELNEKKRQQKDAERRRLREARQELFHSVLKTREEQLKEKQERQRREAEAERAEIELLTLQLEQQDKIREEYNRRCAEQRREYQCQLMKQIQEVEEAKKRKKEEEEMFLRQMKEKEEKEVEETKAIINSLKVSSLDHPMKIIAKENPPKYPCLYPYM